MVTRRAGTVLLAVVALASGCAGHHPDAARHAPAPSVPAVMVHGWSPVASRAARRSHAVACKLATSPPLTVRLRVPVAYHRLRDPVGRTACVWVAPSAIVAQIRVAITSHSLAAEAADQRDPARNGQAAGTSQDGSHDVRLSSGRVFGQRHGERLTYRSDDENVPLRVLEARVAPLTLSMSVSKDGHALYTSADATFDHVTRSLGVDPAAPRP